MVCGEIIASHIIMVMVTASIQMGTSVTIKPNFKPKMITSALVVFFAPCKKAQLERPVWLVHKGGGNGDGGVVVREVELPQQGDHQHVHLHLRKPEMQVETLNIFAMCFHLLPTHILGPWPKGSLTCE